MAGIANLVASLKTEFQEAHQGLKDVDHNIKKLTGREPGLGKAKPGLRRPLSQTAPGSGNEVEEGEIVGEEPERKRRFIAFSRIRTISGPGADSPEEEPRKPTLQSSVVATPRAMKPRTQALEEQKGDKRSMARNKRMFGMILGTLQKFQSEESRRKPTTQKRVEIEKKLDKAAEDEKATIRKERRELYKNRRDKQKQIRKIEHKMDRVEIHQEWEKSHQFLGGFIQTKSKPYIFYMPVKPTPETDKRLKETKDTYRLIVAEKRAKVQKELQDIDESYKKGEEEDEDMDVGDEFRDDEVFTEAISEKPEKKVVVIVEDVDIGKELDTDKGNEPEAETLQVKGDLEVDVPMEPENNGTGIATEESDKGAVASEALGDNEFEPIYDE